MDTEKSFPELFKDSFASFASVHATIPEPYRQAHKHSFHNRSEILASKLCGCFYCGATFAPEEIQEWLDEDESDVGQTAVCPRCGIDSVLGDASGYELSEEFLDRMREHWFREISQMFDLFGECRTSS